MLNDEVNRRNTGIDHSSDDLEDKKSLINISTHISDDYVSDDDLKIEIHKLINTITDKNSFDTIKSELEDRFGKLNEDILIYMYTEWFEKLVDKLHIEHVRESRNSLEMTFPGNVVAHLDTEELFMDAISISHMFRFISRGSNLIIILDTIKLDKHPIYYLVEYLSKIYDKFGKVLD